MIEGHANGSQAAGVVLGHGESRLFRASVAGDEGDRKRWLLCRVGTTLCALPIEHIVEVMRTLAVDQFAGAPKFVRGLSIIRGSPVPVVDLGLVVCGVSIRGAFLVTLREGSRIVALAVDRIIGITGVEGEAVGQLPPLLHEAASETISAIGALDSELLLLLRTGRLVPEEALARLDLQGAAS